MAGYAATGSGTFCLDSPSGGLEEPDARPEMGTGERRTMKQGPVAEGNWRSAAACRSADPDLFFPISAFGQALEQVAEAKAICARCPVRRQCLAFALRTRQAHGIWGGMTEEERALIRQQGSQTA